MPSQKRQYAAHFEYPDKTIKELGIVCEWLEFTKGRYRSPSCGPHPNHAPDCTVLDEDGSLVGVEVCELVDQKAVVANLAGNAVFRSYSKEDFLRRLDAILGCKDRKDYHGEYAKIILIIHTDEPDLTYERCCEWLENEIFCSLGQIVEAYLIFSYDPMVRGYPCIRLKVPPRTFRERVFEVVKKIPRGKTLTYKEVAQKAGRPRAYRAVGNILHTNYDPDIPCHRVVRSDGKSGGWNRGAQEKAALLRKEKPVR